MAAETLRHTVRPILHNFKKDHSDILGRSQRERSPGVLIDGFERRTPTVETANVNQIFIIVILKCFPMESTLEAQELERI